MQATSGEYVRKQTEREENSKGSKKSIAFYSFALMTNSTSEQSCKFSRNLIVEEIFQKFPEIYYY